MKAKEYFEKYVNGYDGKDNDWKLVKTFRDIFCEAQQIAKQRNSTTDRAYQSIFKELNQKANSFLKMVNENNKEMMIKNDAFMIFVELEMPQFYKMVFPEKK